MMSAAVVSSRSDEYRVRAAECLKRAQETRDFEVKRQYEELAHQWLYLASANSGEFGPKADVSVKRILPLPRPWFWC
jgi:hypothetical protein